MQSSISPDARKAFRLRLALTAFAACVVLAPAGFLQAQQPAQERAAQAKAAPSPAALAEYQRKLKAYNEAQARHEALAAPYWAQVEAKRKERRAKFRAREPLTLSDYVLTQPPRYAGPSRPADPERKPEDVPPEREPIPVVADFLRHAKAHFGFVPDRPKDEIAFKRAYAAVASAAGLTPEQAVRVYAFEAGGINGYDVQSGLVGGKPGARAISTALGYNQLLVANTIGLLAEKGDRFVKALQERAKSRDGEGRKSLENKIAILRRMVAHSRTVPARWSDHVTLTRTPKGMALHALNLDIDVGPMLQTQKLLDSVVYARTRGIARPLTASELEMMNLTGDGNGFDMVSMPREMRSQVPTANFFQRRGYERNPIASRTQVVEKLIAETDAIMDRRSQAQGARDLAKEFQRRLAAE